MDWSLVNMAEALWFCQPGHSFFASSPFDTQLEALVLLFHHYGVRRFTVQDVQTFYKHIQVPTLNGKGVVKPQPARIRKTAARIRTLRPTEDGGFDIVPAERGLDLPFDPTLYSNALALGYQRGEL